MSAFDSMTKEQQDEVRELVDENRRLRAIIRKMAEKGDFAPLAIVDLELADGEPRIFVCTANRSEMAIGNAVVDALCEAFGWKKAREPKIAGAGNPEEK